MILTLFFAGRQIFLSMKLNLAIRKKYGKVTDFKKNFPNIIKLYMNLIYYSLIKKDPVLSQIRRKWFLNLLYFAISGLITAILNNILY